MKPARATALLALVEANKALMLAHKALVDLGDRELAGEASDMAADTFAMMTEISAGRGRDVATEVAS